MFDKNFKKFITTIFIHLRNDTENITKIVTRTYFLKVNYKKIFTEFVALKLYSESFNIKKDLSFFKLQYTPIIIILFKGTKDILFIFESFKEYYKLLFLHVCLAYIYSTILFTATLRSHCDMTLSKTNI